MESKLFRLHIWVSKHCLLVQTRNLRSIYVRGWGEVNVGLSGLAVLSKKIVVAISIPIFFWRLDNIVIKNVFEKSGKSIFLPIFQEKSQSLPKKSYTRLMENSFFVFELYTVCSVIGGTLKPETHYPDVTQCYTMQQTVVLCTLKLHSHGVFYQYSVLKQKKCAQNFMMLNMRFECNFKHDSKCCICVLYQENGQKHVKCKHIYLILYFVRKHTSICSCICRIVQRKKLLEMFAVPFFLQHYCM